MKKLIIIGAGGHGKEVCFLVERLSEYELLGFLDDNKVGEVVCGKPVLGGIAEAGQLPVGTHVVFGISSPQFKEDIYNRYFREKNGELVFPNLIDPSVLMGKSVKLGKGNVIMAYTTLTEDIVIGDFNAVNIGCTIGHDVSVGDFNSIYPSVNISGNVNLDNKIQLGVGSQIIQNINIGESVIIGAGSVVINEIADGNKVVGVPAKAIREMKKK
ncbi:acetyltransferase [Enterococcus sp. LJL51]|uniref:acetyltransferase n=1 Tax=Enterococcus sp. LJL51 TaxID=3416656 RepID=UPI003CEB18DE